MATYDYTGSAAGAPAPAPQNEGGRFVVYKKRMKTTEIIAWNATLTTNAKITAGDIFQIIDVPKGFIAMGSAIYTITAEGAAETLDLGIAGGDELQDGASNNGTALTNITLTLVADDWGPNNLTGYDFEAADTIDLKFVSDTTVCDVIVYVWGLALDLNYDA